MIRSVHEIRGYKLQAKDGEFGKVDDVLFDEKLWVIRYLVADTGSWLSGRKVLIPPSVLGKPSWKDSALPVDLVKSEIEESPALDAEAPVSRQFEIMLHRHWRLQPYWIGSAATGAFPVPIRVRGEIQKREQGAAESAGAANNDPFLRSVREVTGYRIKTTDDEIGHVDDFLMDDELWVIRYLVVDTRNWLPGRKVQVPLSWISEINFADQHIVVEVAREKVRNSPEFDPDQPINREQEQVLFDYYGRPHYTEV
jgi:uncharacterized protein YrrD